MFTNDNINYIIGIISTKVTVYKWDDDQKEEYIGTYSKIQNYNYWIKSKIIENEIEFKKDKLCSINDYFCS